MFVNRNPNESPPSSQHISHLFKHNHIASPIEQATSKLVGDVNTMTSHKQKRQTAFSGPTSMATVPQMRRIKRNRHNPDSYEFDDDDGDSDDEDDGNENDIDNHKNGSNNSDDDDDGDDSNKASEEQYDEKHNHDRLDDTANQHIPFWDPYDSVNQLYLEVGK